MPDQSNREKARKLAEGTYAVLRMGGHVQLPNTTIAVLAVQFEAAFSAGEQAARERMEELRTLLNEAACIIQNLDLDSNYFIDGRHSGGARAKKVLNQFGDKAIRALSLDPAPPEEEDSDDDDTPEAVASIAYQIFGVLASERNCVPVRILDYFSAVAHGEHPTNPLPFSPDEVPSGDPAPAKEKP